MIACAADYRLEEAEEEEEEESLPPLLSAARARRLRWTNGRRFISHSPRRIASENERARARERERERKKIVPRTPMVTLTIRTSSVLICAIVAFIV